MIVLVGAGGHGKVIADILLKNRVEKIVFYDVKPNTDTIANILLLSKMPELTLGDSIIVCIGNNEIRKKNVLALNANYSNAIHPFSSIATTAKIGDGSVVMAGVILNPLVSVGKHCIINTNASIDHECQIDDFVHISPGVTLSGNVKIGEGTHVGSGAVITPGVVIGNWVTIGAGAVVINDIGDYSTVVGNPGRIIRK